MNASHLNTNIDRKQESEPIPAREFRGCCLPSPTVGIQPRNKGFHSCIARYTFGLCLLFGFSRSESATAWIPAIPGPQRRPVSHFRSIEIADAQNCDQNPTQRFAIRASNDHNDVDNTRRKEYTPWKGPIVAQTSHRPLKTTNQMRPRALSFSLSRATFLSSLLSVGFTSSLIAKPSTSSAFQQQDYDRLILSAKKHDVSNLESSSIKLTASSLPTKNNSGTTLQESISGFAAGGTLAATKTLVKYPLDTATVRLQMPNSQYSMAKLSSLFEGSFRGIASPLISNIPAGAVFFAVKDATKAALRESSIGEGMPRWMSTSLAVAAAQAPYWLVRNPSEVVKTRQQAGVPGYGEGTNAIAATKKVFQDESVAGLYSGYLENILYAYPADVIKFICYEMFSGGRKNLSPALGAMYGAASTAVAQLVTTPLDVVRNRVMAGELTVSDAFTAADKDGRNVPKESYIGALVKLAQEEGMKGLFAGASPRVGKAVLSGAIQFATYEETKQSIAQWFGRR